MDEKRIVCFGDSNTWGFNPENGKRYGDDVRWTKLLEKAFDGKYRIIEEGQNGRNLANPDPWEWGTKCGMDHVLPVIETHMPMEALVIMLGTNDLKAKFHLPPSDIGGSLQNMLKNIRAHLKYYLEVPDLKILVISPPAIGAGIINADYGEMFGPEASEKSKKLCEHFRLAAEKFDCDFLDATSVLCAGDVDYLHLSPEGHAKLAEMVHSKLDAMLNPEKITELGNPAHPEGEAGALMLQRMADSHKDVTDWGLSFDSFSKDDVVLDVGCGSGMAIKRLAGRTPGLKAYGVDYSDVSVELSRKNNSDLIAENRVEIKDGSVDDLPFADDLFTKVFTVESFYFWPDHNAGLKEIRRVTKPGGKVFIIADIYDSPNLNEKQRENIKKYNMYNPTPEDFRKELESAGFSDVVIHLNEEKLWICAEGTA